MSEKRKPGRPKGSKSKSNKEMIDLLNINKKAILQKAIALATNNKNPNTTILAKLLDKMLPSLTSADLEGTFEVEMFPNLSDSQLKNLVSEFAKVVKNK